MYTAIAMDKSSDSIFNSLAKDLISSMTVSCGIDNPSIVSTTD